MHGPRRCGAEGVDEIGVVRLCDVDPACIQCEEIAECGTELSARGLDEIPAFACVGSHDDRIGKAKRRGPVTRVQDLRVRDRAVRNGEWIALS